MTEYCVMHHLDPDDPHRGPWSEELCREWIREGVEEDGIPPGIFYVAAREVGDWSRLTK